MLLLLLLLSPLVDPLRLSPLVAYAYAYAFASSGFCCLLWLLLLSPLVVVAFVIPSGCPLVPLLLLSPLVVPLCPYALCPYAFIHLYLYIIASGCPLVDLVPLYAYMDQYKKDYYNFM